MFLLVGFGTKQQHLGPARPRFRPFSLFFLPVARWKRQQLDVCGICWTAVEI
jgi:hypothetical protein